MSDDQVSDGTPRRRPPASRRRRPRRSPADPSTEAIRLRARLDAIPDIDRASDEPVAGDGSSEGDDRGGRAAGRRPNRPVRLSRTARVRQLGEAPVVEHPSDPVWEMPPARPVDPAPSETERDEETTTLGAVVPDAEVERGTEDGVGDGDRRRELLDDGLFVPAGDHDVGADGAVAPRGRSRIAPPPKPPMHRRIAFAVVLVLLLGAIPFLGREGYRLVTRSKAGRDATVNLTRTDPNYVEQVQPTPTSVIAQTDDDGELLALTVLALSSERGGTVLFLPLDAQLARPRILVDTVRRLFDERNRQVSSLDAIVGEVLGIGVDRVEAFDSRTFEHWLEPVGEITFVNPDDLTLPDGTHIEPGEISLQPDQVGDYLAHIGEGEDQFSQYLRHQLVWQAWLGSVADDPETRVPGADDDPLAPFISHLASGSTRMETIPGAYDERGKFVLDPFGFESLILDAVPVPRPGPEEPRHRIQLLNGAAPEAPPADVVRNLVALNSTIVVVGNGPSFDFETTEILYSEPEDRGVAEDMLIALGSTSGTVRENPAQADEVEFTVVLGRDALEPDSKTGD